jgi:hypothetical protein
VAKEEAWEMAPVIILPSVVQATVFHSVAQTAILSRVRVKIEMI